MNPPRKKYVRFDLDMLSPLLHTANAYHHCCRLLKALFLVLSRVGSWHGSFVVVFV